MDEYKVVYQSSFLRDLEEIVRSIAAQNPLAAHELGVVILRVGDSLKVFPERFPKVHQRPAIRRYIIKKHYKVFYPVLPAQRVVEVLRCWDGRREELPALHPS